MEQSSGKEIKMNKVILMGRLTRDPEIRYTQGENSMCIARYTLAVDRRVSRNNGDEQTADFISCVAFGKAGEHVEKYYRKGLKVAVTGRIQTGSYTNRDGVKVYTTEVIIEEQEFAESRSSSEHGGSYDNGQDSYDGNGQNQYNGGSQNQRAGNGTNGQYSNQGQRSSSNGGQNQRGGNNANGQYNNQGQRSNGNGGGGQYNGGSQNQRGGNGRSSQYNGQGQRGPDYQDGFMNIPDGIDEELPFT